MKRIKHRVPVPFFRKRGKHVDVRIKKILTGLTKEQRVLALYKVCLYLRWLKETSRARSLPA
jgi:hypothetical protein